VNPVKVASLAYRTDLMIRGLGGSEISDRGSHVVIRTPANPVYWWGNFLLLRSAPQPGEWPGWVAEFAREFPSAQHVALGLDRTDGNVPDRDGLTRLGLDILVDTVLAATSIQPASRAYDIRPLQSDQDWAQLVDLRLALHEGPPDPVLPQYAAAKGREFRTVAEAGHGAWFGAFIDGTMRCGAGLFSDGNGLARFQNVETHPAFRRQGLASALVSTLGAWGLAELGASRLVILADPEYHAIDLYRGLGFADAEHQIMLQRPPAGL
jgi:ribosomal protein S18 acetylase RimI-like enzyme